MAKTTKKPRTKRELDVLRDYACRLFLSGETQRVIAAKTGLTEATVSRWAREENWDARRREQNSSSAALVNSLMLAAKKISELIITKLNKGETEKQAALFNQLFQEEEIVWQPFSSAKGTGLEELKQRIEAAVKQSIWK